MTRLGMLIATWPVTWVLFSIVAWFGFAFIVVWGNHRFHCWQASKAVPYTTTDRAIDALATAVQCTWCAPRPRGLCSCSVRCGHIRCVHLPGRGWTRDDRPILEGKKLP